MDSALLERLKALISERQGVPEYEIWPSSRLAEDLGMAGADGWEFVESFADAFDVDITRFQSDPHFGPEAGSPLVGIILGAVVVAGSISLWTLPVSAIGLVAGYHWLSRRSARSGPYTLTVADLMEYAEAGEWTFDYEQAKLNHNAPAR